ncbi:S24/S26 family peptidase [Butyrivibrio sp. AE2032]|uniref:S24/S26 family peptidase n=1 Tax=Butyrivibrio sp. AE2032 TaxID=1458463 RepID=UPI000552321E|nr:S24/S26 family peptidase [Butyrivibrio sp. AE2032]
MVSFEEELERSGKLVYRNVGVSMRPLIKQDRDIIIISKPEGRLKKYDVPLYKRGDQYVLHRVVKVCEDSYVILGDNCLRKEYGIKEEQILGVLTSLVRNGKEVDLNGFGYRFYSRAWYFLYPVRVIFMKAKSLLGRLVRRCRRAR